MSAAAPVGLSQSRLAQEVSEASLRRVVEIGGLVPASFGLDTVPGVVWVEVRTSRTHRLRSHQVFMHVFGGKPARVWSTIELNRPAQRLEIVCEVSTARWWHRVFAWVRWHYWRAFLDPRRKAKR